MTAVDFILEGLMQELELERELGLRLVEIDRNLLQNADAGAQSAKVPPAKPAAIPPPPGAFSLPPPPPFPNAPKAAVPPPPFTANATDDDDAESDSEAAYEVVFLHHAKLKPDAEEMMNKIIAALGFNQKNAPVIAEGEAPPPCNFYVVLGYRALKKWFPFHRGSPGDWFRREDGAEVLITYSPEKILRFGPEPTAGLLQIKKSMWTSLKTIVQHKQLFKGRNRYDR